MKSNLADGCVKKIVANSREKTLSLFENGSLVNVFHEICFGKNGVKKEKIEGDFCTPEGVFSLGFAFGTNDVDFVYPYYLINENVYWVSDANSKYYNEWVEVTEEKKYFAFSYMNPSSSIDWEEAEHLIDYKKQYELAIVIEYNMEKEKGKGSAIFLHVKNKEYTSGCIATTRENMEFIIRWLGCDKGKIEIK